MATIELNAENFDDTITGNNLVIVDFWAPWCGPCQNFAPIFETASENNLDVVFGKVNADEQQQLALALGIQSIPNLMIFREQILIFSQPGMLSAAQLEDVLTKVRELDMGELRVEIEKQSAAQD